MTETRARALPLTQESLIDECEFCGLVYKIERLRIFRESREIFWAEPVCPACRESGEKFVIFPSDGTTKNLDRHYENLPYWSDEV